MNSSSNNQMGSLPACGSSPGLFESQGNETKEMEKKFCKEVERLNTFSEWPLDFIDKEVLARTGFCYMGYSDKVKCYFCGVEIIRWEASDSVVGEHIRWSPSCPLIRRRQTDNVPINFDLLNVILPKISYDVCGATEMCEVRSDAVVDDYEPVESGKINYLSFGPKWMRGSEEEEEWEVPKLLYDTIIGETVCMNENDVNEITSEVLDVASDYVRTDFDFEEDFKNFSETLSTGVHHVTNNYCYHNYIGNSWPRRCVCMFAYRFSRNDKKVYKFDREAINDLRAIVMDLTIDCEMGSRESFGCYQNHKVVQLILTSLDRNMICDNSINREEFLGLCYTLRSHYGFMRDYGQSHLANSCVFEAQGVCDLLVNICETIKDTVIGATKGIGEFIKMVFNKVKEVILGCLSIISDKFAKMFDAVLKKIAVSIIKQFDPISHMWKTSNGRNNAIIIAFMVIALIVIVVDILGFFTYKLLTGLIDRFIKLFDEEGSYKSEGPVCDPLGGCITLLGLALGLTVFDLKSIASKARDFTALVTAGLGGSWLLGSLFLVLPMTVRTAMTYAYGSQEEKTKELVDSWIVRSSAVIKLRKIPSVLVSDDYYEWLSELIKEAQGLKTKIKVATVSSIFVRNLTSLMETITILENYKREKPFRDYPFSIHLCAPPGFGKTLISSSLVRDLFDVHDNEVYTRPISSEFWDGYINQKVIIMDEFLIGKESSTENIAKEYLELVSTKCFKPPLASIDNPTAGIKGTRSDPIGVLTINNSAYKTHSAVDKDALQRRRELVISCYINKKYVGKLENSKIDLSQMSVDEIRDKAWLRFDILPAIADRRIAAVKNLTYRQLITILRKKLEKHQQVCKTIKESKDEITSDSKTPKELLEDAMRELRGIPNEPISVTDAIFDIFVDYKDTLSGMFSSQGSNAQGMDVKSVKAKLEESFKLMKPKNFKNKSFERAKLTLDIVGKNLREVIDYGQYDSFMALIKQVVKRYNSLCRFYEIDSDVTLDDISHGSDVKMDDDSSDDYNSCDDSLLSKTPQKDMIGLIDHSNVDPTEVHRHRCHGLVKDQVVAYDDDGNVIGGRMDVMNSDNEFKSYSYSQCTYNFAHKHERGKVHEMLCNDCKRNGAEETYLNYHGGFQHTQYPDPKVSPFDLLPEEYDYDYPGEPEGFAEEMGKKWMEIYMDQFVNYGKVPIVIFGGDEAAFDVRFNPKQYLKDVTVNVCKWVGIFAIIYGFRRLVSKFKGGDEDKSELCFSSESTWIKTKESKSERRKRNYETQGNDNDVVTFTFKGYQPCYAYPIKGQTFLTYAHAFIIDGKRIPEGHDVEVRFRDFVSKFKLDYSRVVFENNDDIAFVSFYDLKFPQFPNNVNKFWSESDFQNFNSTSALLNLYREKCYVTVVKEFNKNYAHGDKKIRLENCLAYKCPTQKGDCGSILKSAGQQFPGKIMGIHVAAGRKNGDNLGLATIVTKEDILEALKPNVLEPIGDDVLFSSEGIEIFKGPNLIDVKEIPFDESVFINRKSKLKKSAISSDLETEPQKVIPLMSPNDSRLVEPVDPVDVMINDTLSIDHSNDVIDEELMDEVFSDMYDFYEKNLEWPIGRRRLTFEEALAGVPGYLASMKIGSSAGYPLCKLSDKRGKTEWFCFDGDGQLHWSQVLWEMVHDVKSRVYAGEEPNSRFLAFLKDELVSVKKIKEGRTRLIFCGDLLHNIVYREAFGSMLVAFNHAYENTPSAIGINQYSHDMHVLYDYLSEVGENFIAGDFKNFDKNMQPLFQRKAYELLMNLSGDLVNDKFKNYFVKQQTESSIQFKTYLMKLKFSHFSGCFFTTILNNLVNESYIRYVFKILCPHLIFNDEMRCKFLGDDHIYCVSDKVKDIITPFAIRDELKKLGQIYTSDQKDCELENEMRKFDDITFLGAHPVLYKGKYCGALKKSTLYEMLHWTRNNNLTLAKEVETAVELASMWGKGFYREFSTDVGFACKMNLGYNIKVHPFEEIRRVVAGRTASSKAGFSYGIFADGKDLKFSETDIIDDYGDYPNCLWNSFSAEDWKNEKDLKKKKEFAWYMNDRWSDFVSQGNEEHSIVDLNDSKIVTGSLRNKPMRHNMFTRALNEVPLDLDYGLNSKIYRDQFTWKTSDVEGLTIKSYLIPFDLLSLGDPNNLQNMAFDRYAYWKGDVTISFQINATPFQCGILAVYFVPLASYSIERVNVTAASHVLIQPDQNATYSITVPFIYGRSAFNTQARSTESLGMLKVVPLVRLGSTDLDHVTITVFSTFPNSSFTLPRPVESETYRKEFYNGFGKVEGTDSIDDVDLSEINFEAQGSSQSTINNTYTNISGEMPIQDIVNTTSSSADVPVDVEATIPMPFDNPPLCSGAVPMEQTFSGMAATHGVRPTVDMQLKPCAMSRQQIEIFDTAETKISSICGTDCILTTLTIDTTTPIGTKLFSIDLNTRFGLSTGFGIPINIAALNQFFFWRADVTFNIAAAITKYHSFRLQTVVSYGASGLNDSARNVNLSKIMNFSNNDYGTNYQDAVTVKYNQQTEFLRTYEGENATDLTQNYSLGQFGIYLQNALIAPDTVPNTIQILVFIRFENVKVAVPRPTSPFTWNDNLRYNSVKSYEFIGQRNNSEFIGTRYVTTDNVARDTFKLKISDCNFISPIPPAASYKVIVSDSGNPPSKYAWLHWENADGEGVVRLYLLDSDLVTSDGTVLTFNTVWTDPVGVTPDMYDFVTFDDSIVLLPLARNDEIEYESQGNDVIVSEEKQSTVEILLDEERPVTMSQTKVRPNIPCKIEIGQKFEFCPSDIHEICRRYIRIVPGNNESLQQFVRYSSTTGNISQIILNIGTQPFNNWSNLFSAWAGSLKFRIYGTNLQTAFAPYFNSQPDKPGIPIIDCFNGSAFVYDGKSLSTEDFYSGNLAREFGYPLSNTSWIDVSVPFQSHFNFCYTKDTQSIAPISSGTLSVITPNPENLIIFTAFGDDLRLGVFRPPERTRFNMDAYDDGINGFHNS